MKKTILMSLLVLLVLMLGSCSSSSTARELEDGEYLVYYTDKAMDTLTTEIKSASGSDVTETAYRLVNEMKSPEEAADITLFPDTDMDVRIVKEQNNALSLYFGEAYSEMDATQEILFRAGLVKTLIQLSDVDYIQIYVNEQPLTDASGKVLGFLSASSFLDDSGENINNYEQVTFTLYFAGEDGESLIGEEREMTISSSSSQERQLVKALLSGPEETGLLPTMPQGTELVGVSVKNRIAYVNFSSEFLTGDLETDPYLTIYSLVDSLTELSTVSKVQIMVEGDSTVKFRDMIVLDSPIERNLDYIRNGGQ